MKSYRTARDADGFTLTEILIAIAIIVALAAIVIPVGRSVLARSHKAACLSNLRNIGIGIETWLQDHNGIMPTMAAARSNKKEDIAVLDNTLDAYLTSPDVFRCPADKENFPITGCSYLWNSTQNGRHKMQLAFFGTSEASQIPLVTDKESWHGDKDGVNMLYADYSASGKFQFSTSP